MNIGEAAAASGLPAKTIRYYEDIGLIAPARDLNGYRAFSGADAHRLTFLARARSLGFSIEECRMLLGLYADKDRASADVKAVAARHLEDIDRKIAALEAMRGTLTDLMQRCNGDDQPDCPILDGLAARKGASAMA